MYLPWIWIFEVTYQASMLVLVSNSYIVSAQSEDQRRRHAKHLLAVDQLECSVFYTSHSQKSLLGLKRRILIDHGACL